MHFPAVLSNYNGVTAYIYGLFILTTASLVDTFLRDGCPSCQLTSGVKALKETHSTDLGQ